MTHFINNIFKQQYSGNIIFEHMTEEEDIIIDDPTDIIFKENNTYKEYLDHEEDDHTDYYVDDEAYEEDINIYMEGPSTSVIALSISIPLLFVICLFIYFMFIRKPVVKN